ncbi:MAG: hypothetical protein HC819_18220 [Cyclobacteriaceae bacterium]|nr:hypothetical protein [Cyclobacteriaceae bacterium]
MKRRSHISIFDRFDELSANSVTESYDNAKAFLAELEIEAEDLKVTGVNEFKKALFLAKANTNKANDSYLLEKLKDKFKELFERNATLGGDILKNALSQKKASFQFRNLDKWSDDELRDVLSDTDLSKLLEDLEDS